MPTDSGTNMYVRNCSFPIRARVMCSGELSMTAWVAASMPPSLLEISTNAITPVIMNTIVWNAFAHAADRRPPAKM